MASTNSLDSVYFMTLPEDFKFSDGALKLDTTIPLPIQKKQKDDPDSFNTKDISPEQILAGILTVLAYDKSNPNLNYYRSIIKQARPNIEKEMNEAAILKAKNEEWDLAEELFLVLRGIDPENQASKLNLALFLDQRGTSYRNSGLFEDADAYDNDALNYYQEVMEAEPPIPDAFFNAAFFYLKQHSYRASKDAFETYLALICDEEESDNLKYKKERAQQIMNHISNEKLDDEAFEKSYMLISKDQLDEGLDKIRIFLEKNPDCWNAWFLCGWGLRKAKRFADAEQAFSQALKCGAQDHADTYNELALCLLETKKFDEAKENLYKAFSLEPENIKIISNLGYLHLKMGNKEEAQKFFTAVLEYAPNDPIARYELEKLENDDN